MPSGSASDPLLARSGDDTVDGAGGAVDHRGCPAAHGDTGGWKSARFIIAVEIAERFAFDGVWFNLISYLTGPLGEGNAAAAAAINAWAGVSMLLPLLGGALADNCLGRYRTIALASMLYVLGLGMLALSTLLSSGSGHPSNLQVALFYMSLYLVAVAEGGFKPCLQAFGADQFDPSDPARSSFFNWWYLGIRAGGTVAYVVLSYVQDNVGWGLGFGIPCAIMACSLVVFLLGTPTYRHYDVTCRGGLFPRPHQQASSDWKENVACVVRDAKAVLRLFPIWATCLVYAVALAQSSTFFTKQAATLDRRIGGESLNLKVPPAALQSFIGVTIVAFIPVYDRVVVPLSRRFSGAPSGITMLQRIGVGMLLSLACMALAALVEARRLRVARDAGVADDPSAAVPMSLWWMVPQYVLFGVADVFTVVGLQEFFYDQVPDTLRSLGLALYLSILGVGSFISSALVSAIDRATAAGGRAGSTTTSTAATSTTSTGCSRAQRTRAPRLPLLRGHIQVQEEGSRACGLVMTDQHHIYLNI